MLTSVRLRKRPGRESDWQCQGMAILKKIAVGVSGLHLEKRVLLYTVVDLVNQLEKESSLGELVPAENGFLRHQCKM